MLSIGGERPVRRRGQELINLFAKDSKFADMLDIGK